MAAPRITEAQKQALIDNLQLEITERARHLRAHYALQCSDLRARVERRINRIPMSFRKANMGELHAKHAEATQAKATIAPAIQSKPTTTSSSPAKNIPRKIPTLSHPLPAVPQNTSTTKPPPQRPVITQHALARGKKRKSDEIVIASDKDIDSFSEKGLTVAKNPKRLKTAPAPPAPPAATRPLSRPASRTTTTTATTISKPSDKENDAASESGQDTSLAATKNPKRGPAPRQVSRTVKASASVLSPRSHNSRTLPRSPIKDHPAPPPSSPAKPSYIARAKTALKKNTGTVNKKVVVAEPAVGRRVLRKRK